jgi:hypothetical protein
MAFLKTRRWLKVAFIAGGLFAGWFAIGVVSYQDDTRLDAKIAQSR